MATATVDQITNLSMVEQRGGSQDNGVIMELRREALVSGLDVTGTPDFRILQEALDNLPPGSGIGFGDSPTGHPDLILVERSPRLVPGTTTTCMVELLYKRHFSSIDTLAVGEFMVRGGGSLRQTTTQRNRFGDTLFVCYTHPSDPANSGYPKEHPAFVGATDCMGGDVQVDLPSDTLEFTGRLLAVNPGQIVRAWRGHINSNSWNDGAPGTWRCTEVSFDPWDLARKQFIGAQWLFNFFFQFDPTGWQPDAFYRIPWNGRTPWDWQEGNGVVEVDWYPELDFSSLFPP